MERKVLNDVALGAFILSGLGVLAYMSIAVGGLKVGHALHVSAKFDSAAGLVKDGAVMIAGVNVGSVDGLTVAHDKAVVKLRLNTDAHVRQDVKAAIRMKSLLGEKYIELIPQSDSAPLLAEGGTITETTVPVEIDEVMKTIGPALKEVDPKDISKVVHALALSVGDRGDQIGTAIDQTTATLGTLNRLLSKNEGKIDHLIANLDQTTAGAPELVSKLDKTLENAPQMVARLDRIATNLEPVTKSLADRGPKMVNRLDRFSEQLEPTTDALGKRGPAMLDKTEKTLDALTPSLNRLPKTIDKLNKLVERLDTTLAKIDPVLDQTKGLEVFDTDGSIKVKARLF